MSTRAPKYTARAMATHWRCPPERVPIGWLMSLTVMPIFFNSASAIRRISLIFIGANGRFMARSSEPRKKLRHTSIRPTTARSWYTVATPMSSASRGEDRVTSLPSTFSVPSEWLCSPDMILINVDFPAPLSPSTQVTSPALTRRLMPFSARMAP